MSYIVTKTDGTTLTTIVDGTKDTSATSLVLLGRNYSNYGAFIANDFVWMLENFSNTTAPVNPLMGQLWWKRDDNLLKVFTGTTWKTISSATAATAAPSTTTAGDIWWDTINEQLYIYNGTSPYSFSSWILVGPNFSAVNGKSGALWQVIQDSNMINHDVIMVYLDNVVTGVISNDFEFTPNVAIPGYSTIQTGYNLRAMPSFLMGTNAAVHRYTNYAGLSAPPTPLSNKVIVFGKESSGFSPETRTATSSTLIDLSTHITLSYYINIAGSATWGDPPDVGVNEPMTLQWSYDGITWTTLDTVQPDAYTQNVWTLRTVTYAFYTLTAPVYLRYATTRNGNTGFPSDTIALRDSWALSSIFGSNTSTILVNIDATDIIRGTVENASYLGHHPASKYFRTDIDNYTVGNIQINNNGGLTIGSTSWNANTGAVIAGPLQLYISGNTSSVIENVSLNGNIGVYANHGGTRTQMLFVNGTTGTIEIAADPVTNLGISTKHYVDNSFSNAALLGSPTTTTQTPGDNSTKVSTTAFVHEANVALKQYVDNLQSAMTSGLNGLLYKANIASPTFTGTPQSTTPAQFNNDTLISTTAFVQRALGSFSGWTLLSSTTVLTAAHIGKVIELASLSTTFTVTLPPTSGLVSGASIRFFVPQNTGSLMYSQTIAPSAGDTLNAITANLSIEEGETYDLVYTGSGGMWRSFAAVDPLDTILKGVPVAPTMPAGTANTAIATTEFVISNSGLFPNKIYQANSLLEITDIGVGAANLAIDGVSVLTATLSGVALKGVATAPTWPQTTSNAAIATTSYVRTAATKWDGAAKFVSSAAPDSTLGVNGDFWFQY